MPLLLHQHPLGQETVAPQRSIRIEVFATNWAAYRRVRRADSRGARALLLSTQDSGAPLQRLPPVARAGMPRWSGSQCDPPSAIPIAPPQRLPQGELYRRVREYLEKVMGRPVFASPDQAGH